MKYVYLKTEPQKFVIFEEGKDYLNPSKWHTFAFDTETQTYFDGRKANEKELKKLIDGLSDTEKRKHVSNITWAWQVYDEVNGFFMTNDFETFLTYVCLCGYKFGYVYNATFDFAQIDYEILAKGRDKWKPHEYAEDGKAYSKKQPYTYESLHNDMGARYSYKLWFPYRAKDRHKYVHAFEIHDFAKFVAGGLARLLVALDVTDNEGNPVRKLTMEYQDVDPFNMKQEEIDYCCNDVKGLYFGVKKFGSVVEEVSNGESHIFGTDTNVMTAGGLAKRELLRSLYPNVKPCYRLSRYQKQHPLTAEQDKYLRENHLYRGGISFVNERYRGKLLKASEMGSPMYRYDVNSEYPYSMASIRDLVGAPCKKRIEDYLKMSEEERERYECVYILESVTGKPKRNMLPIWYDPFKKKYVSLVDENARHLMFKREFDEMLKWYDLEYTIDYVLLWKRGDYVYRPFVEKYYEIKAQSKRDGNAVMQAVAKLLLNSSYGKLSERSERVTGHYELNEDTGAIHFVTDDVEQSTSTMNVAIGALVTAFARTYILSHIREICKGNPKKYFVYIDTDSVHAFAEYDKADAFTLGAFKLEAKCEAVKYLLPKTYFDLERTEEDGTIDIQGKTLEIHSKGVSIGSVKARLMKEENLTLDKLSEIFDYGQKFGMLCAMNVRGGKVLLPVEKFLAKADLRPEPVYITNISGLNYLTER